MSSKREEERNEKIIRGLLKLPPNRRCINCNSLGPQYVCTNFWTFVCTACSGIHREFTHRVKSVSMAKFTTQEVESLQNGGNQRARELFLKDWDMQSMRFPDSSYPDKIREFIKNVYVNKKYAGGRSSDKPPKDPQGLKTYEEHRRASSYHSFSQSPPYDHQYEDRRYGRQGVMLTRKPGSDHGHYERNISSILYSPGRGREHIFEDRFANGNSGSRISNFSDPSTGDPSRSGGQSPNTYISSPSKQISSSSESFGSFDGNSIQPKSTKSGVLPCQVSGPEHTFLSQLPKKSTIPSAETSTSQNAASQDLYRQQFLQQQNTKTIPVDFFADFSNQASFPTPAGNEPSSVPALENEGWAVFDSVNRVAPIAQPNKSLSSGSHPRVEGSIDIIDSSSPNQDNSKWLSAQNSASHGASISTEDQWHAVFNENQDAPDSKSLPQLGHRHELMKSNGDNSSWFLAQNSSAYWPSESTANQWHASYKEIQNAAESRGSPQLMGHQQEPMRSNQDNSQWFSAQNSAAHGAPISTADPWYAGFNEIENVAGSRSLPVWNDFSDSVDGNPQALCLNSSESHFLVPNEDALQVPLVIDESTGSQPSDALTYEVRTTQGWKSSNPFDAPYDMEPGASNMFDVSSLQSAMPNAQLPNEFLDSFSQPWFQQKSASTFMPSIPQSGLPYMGGQVPSSQFPNIPSQGSVASGNPFA